MAAYAIPALEKGSQEDQELTVIEWRFIESLRLAWTSQGLLSNKTHTHGPPVIPVFKDRKRGIRQ